MPVAASGGQPDAGVDPAAVSAATRLGPNGSVPDDADEDDRHAGGGQPAATLAPAPPWPGLHAGGGVRAQGQRVVDAER